MGIKITASFALDMNAIDFSGLLYGSPFIANSTTYSLVFNSDYVDQFKGVGFKYDAYWVPVAGTIKSFSESYLGTKFISMDGLNIKATSLVNAAITSSLVDDLDIVLTQMKGDDVVNGSKYNDFLWAAGGRDTIKGNGGNDVILSGPGADKLYGGSGADSFVFASVLHSTVSTKDRDTIFDFTSSDRIDVSLIDANMKKGGDQAFSFIGTKAFSGHAGELRYDKKASDTYISGDVNGDKKADFTIHLDDAVTMQKGYFFL